MAHAQRPKLPKGFQGRVLKAKFEMRAAGYVTSFWLGGGWCNRVVFYESLAQVEVTILHLGGSISSCRTIQRYIVLYGPWGGTRTLFYCCTMPKNAQTTTQLHSSHTLMEKAMAPHSSTLAWKIPWTEEPCGLQSMGSLRVRHDWVTSLSLFTFMHWRRKWQPAEVFLAGESQGRWSLMGWSLWGRTEWDTTEAT